MLKSKSVAKIIENELNSINKDEQFKILDSVGDYKGSSINGILKQGRSTITPIMNYINATVPYTLDIIVPYQCGEDRADNIVNIVNLFIKNLNGKVKVANGGKIIFLFDTIDLNEYETRASVGTSAKLGVSFVVNYSNKDVGTKYEMALLNNDFVGTINTRYFNNQEEQYKWYYSQITNAPFSELLTPNINSLVISQQRYVNEIGTDANELSMYNYAIIRETKQDGTINHYYYEVTNANVDQYNILSVDLRMDTLQTWYFNPNIKFDDCFVSKADINRFVQDEEDVDSVRFDTRPESELFEREDIQGMTKRLVSREVINPVNGIVADIDIKNWLDENILGWNYIYLSSNVSYPVGNFSEAIEGTGIKFKSINYLRFGIPSEGVMEGIYNSIVCVCFPVFKTDKSIIYREITEESSYQNPTYTDVSLIFNKKGLEQFLSDVGAANIYAIKFSQVPPINEITGHIAETEVINGISYRGDLIVYAKKYKSEFIREKEKYTYYVLGSLYGEEHNYAEIVSCYDDGKISYGLYNVVVQFNTNLNIDYYNPYSYSFYKQSIINSDHNIKYNPKLLTSDYSSIILSDNLQNGAEYDILKLGKKRLTIKYTEALTPDITKRYIRFGDLDGFYIPELDENLTGYIVVDDTSLTIESLAYQTMLANNKNFYLQNSINREAEQYRANLGIGNSIATSLLGVVGSAATGTLLSGGNPIGGVIGAVAGLASSGVSIGTSIANSNKNQEISKTLEKLQVDNLKNAPNSINGAKGNVIFNAMYSDMGIVVERHEIIPNEKKMVDDRMNMFGMTVNKVKNIKDYDNLRRYHNYIEADIEGIKGVSISNAIREDIRQRFTNGVRFWNKNQNGDFAISYEKENYERWLEG